MEFQKLISKINLKYPEIIFRHEYDQKLTLINGDGERSVGIRLPYGVTILKKYVKGKISFFDKGIIFFSFQFENIGEDAFILIEKWLVEGKDLSVLRLEYENKIEIESGVELLEIDIRKYIQWSWQRNIDERFGAVNLLGYRELYELFQASEFSKYVPVFHGHMGLSVSNYVNFKKTKFPYIGKTNDYYIIHRIDKDPRKVDDQKYNLSTIFQAYRKYFPKELDWATYSDHYKVD